MRDARPKATTRIHMASAQVTAADRFGFTLFLALAAHGLLIFGIDFVPEPARAVPGNLEVTLVMHRDDKAPRKADFIAQANRQGSGNQDEKKALTTDRRAPFPAADPRSAQLRPAGASPPRPVTSQKVVITHADSNRATSDRHRKAEPETPSPQTPRKSPSTLSRRIASLQARLAAQKQAYARRPRIRRLTSVSAKAHYEALYINDFRRRVEAMGTRHFPRRALASDTFGSVRLMVALRSNGQVKDIEVLESSGHRFLDRAAVKSVRLAAPFRPFTPEMRKHMDVLEIIRTWKFDANRRLSSH